MLETRIENHKIFPFCAPFAIAIAIVLFFQLTNSAGFSKNLKERRRKNKFERERKSRTVRDEMWKLRETANKLRNHQRSADGRREEGSGERGGGEAKSAEGNRLMHTHTHTRTHAHTHVCRQSFECVSR